MKKLHLYSGLIISLFVFAHLANHALIFWGEEVHLAFMDGLRRVYRYVVVEALLIAAVVLQVFSGIKLFVKRRKFRLSGFDRLQLYSGTYLAFFLLIHVSAVLIARSYFLIDTDLYFGAAGLNLWPFQLFFIPYYFLAVLAFFIHLACAYRISMMGFLGGKRKAELHAKIIIGLGVILSTLIIIGMQGVEIPQQLRELYGQ
ncbi:MAG: hypothetical protein AAF502_11315 [Bacteroidota bacterium]